LITEKVSLGQVWPEVVVPLQRALAHQGLPRDAVDDVVQEVAARVIEHDVASDSAEDLLRWARVVGRRLGVDWFRAQARVEGQPSEDMPARHDVSVSVEQRLALAATLDGLRDLPVDDRELVITPQAQPGHDRRERVRLAVRRHRLRAHLAHLANGLLGLPIAVRLWGRFGPWLRRNGEVADMATAAAPMLVVAIVPLLVGGTSATPAATPQSFAYRPPAVSALVSTARVHVLPAVHALSRPPRADTRRPEVSPASHDIRAHVEVDPPGPVPAPWIDTGPRRPDEQHVACVTLPGLPMTCVG